MAFRQWSVDQEIKLLSLICDFKPAGALKHKNRDLLLQRINYGSKEKFTQDDIEAKLETWYNMVNVDKIEEDNKDEAQDGAGEVEALKISEVEELNNNPAITPKAKTRQNLEKRTTRQGRFATNRSSRSKDTIASNNTPEASDNYSSELSDVEAEEADFSKLKNNEMNYTIKTYARRKVSKDVKIEKDSKDAKDGKDSKYTRSAKDAKSRGGSSLEEEKSSKELEENVHQESSSEGEKTPDFKTQSEQAEAPVTRKRTRANAKLDNVEELPAKKVSRSATKKIRRKSISEEPEKAESPEAEDEPKKRRSVRQTTKRGQKK